MIHLNPNVLTAGGKLVGYKPNVEISPKDEEGLPKLSQMTSIRHHYGIAVATNQCHAIYLP
jgi:hypothetical protein